MRSLTALLVTLLAVVLPSPALAGTFTVAFGYGTPMTGAGWVTNAQAGPICGYEGVGTLWLNAGTLQALTVAAPGEVHLLDSTTTKAHRSAAGAKGGPKRRRSAAHAAAVRPRSTPSSMAGADRSPSR